MQILKKLTWSFGDQAASSVSNLLLSIVLAQQLSLSAFGGFALAYAVYQVMVGVSRASVGEPTLIRVSLTNERDRSAHVGAGTFGASLWLGIVFAPVCLGVGLLTDGPVAAAFLVLGACAPMLMVFDGLRYWCFARGRARSAFLLDFTWLLVQIVGFVVLLASRNNTLVPLMGMWGLAAGLVAIVYLTAVRTAPSLRAGLSWYKSHRDLSPRFLGEYATISGVQQSVILFTVAFVGVESVGAIRAGQVILGPLNVVTAGIAVIVLPILARSAKTRLSALPKMSGLISVTLAGMAVLYGALAMFLPDSAGIWMLGDSWASGSSLILPLVLATAAGGLSYGATSALRAMQ
ncbi:hypothetical protein JF66_21610, partial [Cryobacterium sp. MLB-32]